MQQITDLLYQLSEARAAAEVLRLDKQAAIDAAIPAEVKAALLDIDLEFDDSEQAAAAKIAEMEAAVKAAVLANGETVKAHGINAVHSAGRVSWDSKALDGYALNHPELFAFRKEGKPSVSLRNA